MYQFTANIPVDLSSALTLAQLTAGRTETRVGGVTRRGGPSEDRIGMGAFLSGMLLSGGVGISGNREGRKNHRQLEN